MFAGAGGLSKGLEIAGFSVVAGIENARLACETYKLNMPNAELFERDVRDLPPEEVALKLQLSRGDLDLLAGCPPCQSFSTLRTRNGSVKSSDPSRSLIGIFTSYIEFLHPKCVLLENVPGITKSRQFCDFRRSLTKLGYEFTYSILNACDYSVPQYRKRLVLMASRFGHPTLAPTSGVRISVKEAFNKLDSDLLKNDPLHHYPQRRSERILKLIKAIPQNGGSRTELPEEMQLKCHKKTTGFRDVYGRMSWESPAPTITGGCINPSRGRFLHPTEDRAITLREAAALQGFPQDYCFSLSKGYHSTAQMIGNAFPPPFVSAQAERLKDLLC